MNLYGFANGDPVNFTDPFGLFPCCSDNSKAEVQRELDLAKYGADHPGVAAVAGAVMLGVTTGGLLAGAAPVLTAAPAAAAGSAAASKIPFEGFQEWGRTAVGWGQNAAGAVRAMGEMTAEKAASLDPAKVRAAKAFYEAAVAGGKGGTAAPARVELMQKILDHQP